MWWELPVVVVCIALAVAGLIRSLVRETRGRACGCDRCPAVPVSREGQERA